MRQERFRLQVATIVDPEPGADEWSPPLALVSGPSADPGIRLHSTRVRAEDDMAAAALAELVEALKRVEVEVTMTAGRMLILNNRRGVHRRAAFTPTYASDERWLLRSYLLTDPWSRRGSILDGRVDIAPVLEKADSWAP